MQALQVASSARMDLQCRVLSGWSLHDRYLASQRELDLGDVRPRRAVDEDMEITQFLQFRQRAEVGLEVRHARLHGADHDFRMRRADLMPIDYLDYTYFPSLR